MQTLVNWSGGKDSALALHRIRQQGQFAVQHLLTTINGAFGRVSMHGVREELIEAQAERLGLPLTTVRLPETASMELYQATMDNTLRPLVAAGVTHSVFGDIFLEDLRRWREEQLAITGLTGVFPLWKVPSLALLDEFWAAGFQTIVVAVNGQHLDRSFCGRVLDRQFVADLPAGVDPCGENGEFHTFVFDAPYFSSQIDITVGEVVERTYTFTDAEGQERTSTYFFADLLPNK
ncbi:Dph6-related ATP pyrophosphatase [Fibrella forsythiae]|uniref:Diphthine--ammonia ligase n=1 Tax=Fibrella forsythiae TaxID=2817061 RepID=A0ABS3JBR9_9BACT|nr:diphthine--ammonia ligase [Fibrella forsythiae]MBO0947435.1 diphthine--ammonia ligase [Fibrella forsythiae]